MKCERCVNSAYFYDSYVITEYLNDNPAFVRYFKPVDGVLTFINLFEVCYSAICEAGIEKVKQAMEMLRPLASEPTKDEIIESAQFRKGNSRKSLSYADCIGYIIAKKCGMKFLTGDTQFKGMDNVEFVE